MKMGASQSPETPNERESSTKRRLPAPVDLPRRERPRANAWWPWLVGIALVGLGAWGWATRGGEPKVGGGPVAESPAGVAVVAVPIQRDDVTVRERYPGELFADAVELSSRITGHVLAIDVRIGDRVEAGQVIARIDDSVIRREIKETKAQLAAAKSALLSAEVAASAADREYRRVAELTAKGAISDQESDTLQTAAAQRQAERATAEAQADAARARIAVLEENLHDTEIRAPFAGVIARRDVDPGAFVQPSGPLVRLVAEDPLRVRFKIPEYDVAKLRVGQSFTIETQARLEQAPQGEVARMAGEVSPLDRSLMVEGVVKRENEAAAVLRPGMFAEVVLDRGKLEDAWVVPAAAVLERVDSEGRPSIGVFTVGDAVARWIDVDILGRESDRVAIASKSDAELTPDLRVLIRGHRDLADGSPIRLVQGDTP